VTRSASARVAAQDSWARTPARAARARPAHNNNMLAKFTREARERLGPDATERQVAKAAELARKAFYKRLSAAGVAARKAALHEALVSQRRLARLFAGQDARPGAGAGGAGSAG
jgi:hypothetical protein